MRCGSSSLYRWIARHDEYTPPRRKEIHFFNHHFDKGLSWYRAFFPIAKDGIVTFEATPAYLSHPLAAQRASETVPDAKIIASLRDPVERAWSHYRFRRALGYEARSFHDAIEDELTSDSARSASSPGRIAPYLAAGRYGDHLPAWMNGFGRDRVLLLDADALFAGDTQMLDDIDEFLELPLSHVPLSSLNSAPAGAIDEGIRVELQRYFSASNSVLASLTGRPFKWLDT
jgi:hypothetical protein